MGILAAGAVGFVLLSRFERWLYARRWDALCYADDWPPLTTWDMDAIAHVHRADRHRVRRAIVAVGHDTERGLLGPTDLRGILLAASGTWEPGRDYVGLVGAWAKERRALYAVRPRGSVRRERLLVGLEAFAPADRRALLDAMQQTGRLDL